MIKGIIPKINYQKTFSLPVMLDNNYSIAFADNVVLRFLNDLSKNILKEPSFKLEPSFVALGFWLRKKNIQRILFDNEHIKKENNFIVKPLGKVLHICPSNVDTMFIYSLVLSLLAGNKNIVRISSKLENIYIFKIFEIFNQLIQKKDFEIFENYINVITYERSDIINEEFSSNVNGRIIWGGDETIKQFKRYSTKPKVKDLYFTDKVSLSIINIEDINDFDNDYNDLIKNLYNDIYTFNQKGCSSPQSLLLIGKNIDKEAILLRIYKSISQLAEEKYNEDISSVSLLKLNQGVVDVIEDKVSKVINTSSYLTLAKIHKSSLPHSCGGGYLYYDLLESLDESKQYINERTQTISYSGLSKETIKSLLQDINVEYVDRIVPIGKALDFDYIWDGYNILVEMTTLKSIK